VSDLSNLLREIKQSLFVICIYLTLVPLRVSKCNSYSFLRCQFSPLPLSPCKCPPNVKCRGASAANMSNDYLSTGIFKRENFFPEQDSGPSESSEVMHTDVLKLPLCLKPCCVIFPSTSHNSELISAARKEILQEKSWRTKHKVLIFCPHAAFCCADSSGSHSSEGTGNRGKMLAR